MESSFQAQFLVPMATSIAFGLMLSTVLVLFQVPVFFQLYLLVSEWLGVDLSHPAYPGTLETPPEKESITAPAL
jgi:hypothetical protein